MAALSCADAGSITYAQTVMHFGYAAGIPLTQPLHLPNQGRGRACCFMESDTAVVCWIKWKRYHKQQYSYIKLAENGREDNEH